MSTPTQAPPKTAITYPDSDGQPMADNTLQFEWIVTIKEGLSALFADRADVFVAGDLLWYPVEGDPKTRAAPDALVAFGRPKGYRGSYRQWEEGGVAPQVVFEVQSPGNRFRDLIRKLEFYDRFGAEEYYLYDPFDGSLSGWRRVDGRLELIEEMSGWTSPRLGVRFELDGETLRLVRPDGQRFLTYAELFQAKEAESQRADAESQRADAESQRADAERQRADAERQKAERLAERLRALGVDPEAV